MTEERLLYAYQWLGLRPEDRTPELDELIKREESYGAGWGDRLLKILKGRQLY